MANDDGYLFLFEGFPPVEAEALARDLMERIKATGGDQVKVSLVPAEDDSLDVGTTLLVFHGVLLAIDAGLLLMKARGHFETPHDTKATSDDTKKASPPKGFRIIPPSGGAGIRIDLTTTKTPEEIEAELQRASRAQQ